MALQTRIGAAAAVAATLMLAGCGGGSMFSSRPAAAPQPAAMQPVTTAEGIQQFSVPADGRTLLSGRLTQLVPGPIHEARISNAWRTAAAAAARPNDYAACVAATTDSGTQTFMMVKSGPGVGDVFSGEEAAKRCGDPKRVVQWVPLGEVLAAR